MTPEEQQQSRNWERWKMPSPGDYWYSTTVQDHQKPYFVVLAVGYKDIMEECIFVVCDHVLNDGQANWKFDLSKSRVVDYTYFDRVRSTDPYPKFLMDVYIGEGTRPMIIKWVNLGHPIVNKE